jgi:cytochrome c5
LTSAVFVIIALPAYLISAYQTPPRQPDPQAIAERLQKVGSVALSVAVATDRPVATGEEVYKKQCSICHAAGTLGAPKFEDAAAWAPRLGQGYDALVQSSLRGKNNMPAQGGAAFSDYEIARAVAYMANAAGAQFEEPPPPQGAASDVPAANNADAAASDADATDGVDSANDAAAATDEAAAAP